MTPTYDIDILDSHCEQILLSYTRFGESPRYVKGFKRTYTSAITSTTLDKDLAARFTSLSEAKAFAALYAYYEEPMTIHVNGYGPQKYDLIFAGPLVLTEKEIFNHD